MRGQEEFPDRQITRSRLRRKRPKASREALMHGPEGVDTSGLLFLRLLEDVLTDLPHAEPFEPDGYRSIIIDLQ